MLKLSFRFFNHNQPSALKLFSVTIHSNLLKETEKDVSTGEGKQHTHTHKMLGLLQHTLSLTSLPKVTSPDTVRWSRSRTSGILAKRRKKSFTCTHTHACMRTHTRTYTHTHAHTHTRTCTHTHIHTHTCTHTHTHTYTKGEHLKSQSSQPSLTVEVPKIWPCISWSYAYCMKFNSFWELDIFYTRSDGLFHNIHLTRLTSLQLQHSEFMAYS